MAMPERKLGGCQSGFAKATQDRLGIPMGQPGGRQNVGAGSATRLRPPRHGEQTGVAGRIGVYPPRRDRYPVVFLP